MKIQTYVKKNWNKLPKSNFNEDEVVIAAELHNSDEGWGNHSYAGIGLDKDGEVYLCTSSGCSCQGSCGIEKEQKTRVKHWYNDSREVNLETLDPKTINYDSLVVSFHDYE